VGLSWVRESEVHLRTKMQIFCPDGQILCPKSKTRALAPVLEIPVPYEPRRDAARDREDVFGGLVQPQGI